MAKKKSIFERRPALFLSLFLLIIIFIIDALSGILFIKENYNSFRTQHHYYHHGLRPNQESSARWSVKIYPFTTNSLGFRDAETKKIPLKTENRRILIMGDSHTEGVDLPFEETFVGILSEKGREQNVEVISAAAISYSPKIHYLIGDYLIDLKGLECSEIFVLIDISDIQNELVYEDYEPGRFGFIPGFWNDVKNFTLRNSFIAYSIKQLATRKGKSKLFGNTDLFDSGKGQPTLAETYSIDLYYSFFTHFNDDVLLANPRFHGVGDWLYDEEFKVLAEKGIQLGQENILKLKEICDAHNIKLTIAVHPWHPQIERRMTDEPYVKNWKSFAETNGIGFVNLYPVFINEQNPVAIIERYYIFNDNHWNKKGHKEVAEYLEKVLF